MNVSTSVPKSDALKYVHNYSKRFNNVKIEQNDDKVETQVNKFVKMNRDGFGTIDNSQKRPEIETPVSEYIDNLVQKVGDFSINSEQSDPVKAYLNKLLENVDLGNGSQEQVTDEGNSVKEYLNKLLEDADFVKTGEEAGADQPNAVKEYLNRLVQEAGANRKPELEIPVMEQVKSYQQLGVGDELSVYSSSEYSMQFMA